MCRPFDEKLIYKNPKAALSEKSRGRLTELDPCNYRTEYQRDIHRIIYSQAFRRLRHKTQVFFLPNNDHICTRMEHVLHVASASRTVARHLGLNEDLAEAIGLGHDLGHAPFGHHGESILNQLAKEHDLPTKFQHEIHGLRVVDRLAELDREPGVGLNLTFEVRDGIISHNGEDFKAGRNEITPQEGEKDLAAIQERTSAGMPVTLEGCIVRMVDRITYAGRDVEDAIVAGLLDEATIPADIVGELGKNNGQIIGTLLADLIEYSKAKDNAIGMSTTKNDALAALILHNYNKIYLCDKVNKFKKQATLALKELFSKLLEDLEKTKRLSAGIDELPDALVYTVLRRFIKKIDYDASTPNAQIVLDFMSGMTDNYVVECLDEIFVPKCIT
jgi:dGTPase